MTTWLIAGMTAVATASAITLALMPRRRASGSSPRPREDDPDEYVGKIGYAWPHADIFPTVDAFGDLLERLGYDSGDWLSDSWSVIGSDAKQATLAFQNDYNAVRKTIEQPPTPALVLTGRIDEDTVNALAYVASVVEQSGMTWPSIVFETKSAGIT